MFWFFLFGKNGRQWEIDQTSGLEKDENTESIIIDNELDSTQIQPESDQISNAEEKIEDGDDLVKDEKEEVTESTEITKDELNNLSIKNNLVSFGFQKFSGTRKIDTIVIHSSYNSLGGDQYSLEKIIAIYKDYGVAPHYIIDRAGVIYQLVKENDIAYHAGVSSVPDGRTDVNKFSIGIELVGNETDGYTKKQYEKLQELINKIKNEREIKYVLGHDEIAPERKTDPWVFDWNKISK